MKKAILFALLVVGGTMLQLAPPQPRALMVFTGGFKSLPHNPWKLSDWYAHFFDACSNTSFSNGFTCVQQIGNKNAGLGTTVTGTFGGNTVAGHAVIVAGFTCNASCTNAVTQTMTFSDGAGDTVTLPTTACTALGSGTTFAKICVAIFANVSATTTFTLTLSATGDFAQIVASEWTGIGKSNPFDGNATYNSSTGATSLTTNYTSGQTDLIFGFTSVGGAPTITVGSGFTEIGQTNAGTQHEGKSAASGTNNCAASWTGTHEVYQLCAGFRQALGPTQVGGFLTGP